MALLTDKVTVITGAGSGIGAGIARIFASRGAKLSLADIHPGRLQEVVKECIQLGLTQDDIHQVFLLLR